MARSGRREHHGRRRGGDEPFEAVHDALHDDRLFPAVDVHGTTTRWVYVFERKRR